MIVLVALCFLFSIIARDATRPRLWPQRLPLPRTPLTVWVMERGAWVGAAGVVVTQARSVHEAHTLPPRLHPSLLCSLHDNEIGPEGMETLSEALKVNSSIKDLG